VKVFWSWPQRVGRKKAIGARAEKKRGPVVVLGDGGTKVGCSSAAQNVVGAQRSGVGGRGGKCGWGGASAGRLKTGGFRRIRGEFTLKNNRAVLWKVSLVEKMFGGT